MTHLDNFYYVCRKFTSCDQQKYIDTKLKTSRKYYFGYKIVDQEKGWAPHICCPWGLHWHWMENGRDFAIVMPLHQSTNHFLIVTFEWPIFLGSQWKNKLKTLYAHFKTCLIWILEFYSSFFIKLLVRKPWHIWWIHWSVYGWSICS